MNPDPVPVVLVHGWNSHPGAWKQLCSRLDDAKIPSVRFDHTGMDNASLGDIARALGQFISRWREDTGYSGIIDVVSH